jgi:hypothetical protein
MRTFLATLWPFASTLETEHTTTTGPRSVFAIAIAIAIATWSILTLTSTVQVQVQGTEDHNAQCHNHQVQ